MKERGTKVRVQKRTNEQTRKKNAKIEEKERRIWKMDNTCRRRVWKRKEIKKDIKSRRKEKKGKEREELEFKKDRKKIMDQKKGMNSQTKKNL